MTWSMTARGLSLFNFFRVEHCCICLFILDATLIQYSVRMQKRFSTFSTAASAHSVSARQFKCQRTRWLEWRQRYNWIDCKTTSECKLYKKLPSEKISVVLQLPNQVIGTQKSPVSYLLDIFFPLHHLLKEALHLFNRSPMSMVAVGAPIFKLIEAKTHVVHKQANGGFNIVNVVQVVILYEIAAHFLEEVWTRVAAEFAKFVVDVVGFLVVESEPGDIRGARYRSLKGGDICLSPDKLTLYSHCLQATSEFVWVCIW